MTAKVYRKKAFSAHQTLHRLTSNSICIQMNQIATREFIVDKTSSKKINSFIENDSRDLQTVYEKINMLGQLSSKVMLHLDPIVAKYCQVANLVNGKLTLIVANGSVATQLRFQINEILRKIRQDPSLKHITSIECKVRPSQHQASTRLAATSPKIMPALSPQTAEIVKNIADSIADPELKEVMTRIAGRVKE